MIEINSVEQFNEKVKGFRAANEKTASNCFLMPAEIMSLASENRLFVAEYPKWLLILCDREDYSNLYYYTTADSDETYVKEFLNSVSDRAVYMDIVTRSGRGDCDTPERLIKAGVAQKYKTYQRMQLPLKSIDSELLTKDIAEGYKISTDYCDFDALTTLWKEALDEKSTPLPQQAELLKLRDEGNLFTVLDSQGELAAVIMDSVSSKQGLLQHLSVSVKHRRKGLARSVMCKSIFAAIDSGLTMVRLWVDSQNSSAIALYDRLKFEKDGMICDQLYMKGN